MMLKGLGDCVPFDVQTLYSLSWASPTMIKQAEYDALSNGNCMPDWYVSSGLVSTQTIDSYATNSNLPAPPIAAPTPISSPLPPVTNTTTTTTSGGVQPGGAQIGTTNISVVPPITNTNTVVNQTAAAASSGLPATIFGINSTYVLIGGALVAFMFLGGKR